MRYLVLLLITAVALWFIISSDAFKGLVSNAIPGIDPESDGPLPALEKMEAAKAKQTQTQKPFWEDEDEEEVGSGAPDATTSARTADGEKSGDPKEVVAIQIDKEKLVGGWLSESDNEFIIFRADGKARVVVAWRMEVDLEDIALYSATATGVIFSDWEIQGGSVMFTKSNVEEMKLARSNIASKVLKRTDDYDAWNASQVNQKIRAELDSKMKIETNKWLLKNRVGGAVTRMDERLMTIEYKTGPIHYERVNPFTTKDPDGSNAPIMYKDPATGEMKLK